MPEIDTPSPLAGAWQMVRAELNGDMAPELVVQQSLLTFSGDTYRVSFDRSVVDVGTYKVSTIGSAHRLSLHCNSGPNSGRIIEAIFQQAGQRLRICFGLDGSTPVTFSTEPGSNRYLATYRLLT